MERSRRAHPKRTARDPGFFPIFRSLSTSFKCQPFSARCPHSCGRPTVVTFPFLLKEALSLFSPLLFHCLLDWMRAPFLLCQQERAAWAATKRMNGQNDMHRTHQILLSLRTLNCAPPFWGAKRFTHTEHSKAPSQFFEFVFEFCLTKITKKKQRKAKRAKRRKARLASIVCKGGFFFVASSVVESKENVVALFSWFTGQEKQASNNKKVWI